MAKNVTLRDPQTSEEVYPETSVDNIYDLSEWVKSSSKPTYTLAEVGISISTVSLTSSVSSSCSITGSSNTKKSLIIIYINNSGSNKVVTVPTTYKTPNGAAIELIVPTGGYCEVNYLNIGGTIYARGA